MKGSDPKVQNNHLHHYISLPFEERRLEWGNPIYHSGVVCIQSYSVKQACIYTIEDTIVCDEICIHTNCSMDSVSTSSLPIEVQSAESAPTSKFESETSDSNLRPPIRTWDLQFNPGTSDSNLGPPNSNLGPQIQTRDLQSEDDTNTQKGLTQKCGRITSVLH